MVKKSGKLHAVVSKIGDATLAAVAGDAVQTVTDLALSGAFG